MKKFFKVIYIIIFIFLLIGISNITYADSGPKPSITIKIKNLKTTNYIIDLFTYTESDDFSTSLINDVSEIKYFNSVAEDRRNNN